VLNVLFFFTSGGPINIHAAAEEVKQDNRGLRCCCCCCCCWRRKKASHLISSVQFKQLFKRFLIYNETTLAANITFTKNKYKIIKTKTHFKIILFILF
jgi:hypothetical protein